MADSRQGVGTLTIGSHEFATQAAAVKLTPDISSEDGTPTLAVPAPPPQQTIGWALNIDAIQDFEDPVGIVNYLMDNALDEVAFTWTPNTDAATPVVYSGTVQIVPMEIGGDVAVQNVTSVELPLVGEPTRTGGTTTTARGAREEAVA